MEQFTQATVFFKNRSVTVAPMNYDVTNNVMYYKANGTVMELTNSALIDSIVWPTKYKFVVHQDIYLHELPLPNGRIFIHWRIREVNIGKQGALGLNTQAKVEQIDLKSIGIYTDDQEIRKIDIYKMRNNNEYFILHQGGRKKVTNLKSLLKLYPQHTDNLRAFAKSEHIDMNHVSDALKIINYALGLKY